MSKDLPGQMSLFAAPRTGRDEYADEKPIRLNPTVHEHDVPRLAASVHRLVERLREGPATGNELETIAGRRFSARLGEARDNGLIRGWKKRHMGGATWEYTLIRGEGNGDGDETTAGE